MYVCPGPPLLGVARHHLGTGASLQLGDAAAMPYPGQAFDLVLAATVLHEMDSLAAVGLLLGGTLTTSQPDDGLENRAGIYGQRRDLNSAVIRRIAGVFASAEAEGFLHACAIGAGQDRSEVSIGADSRVVLASVFKIVIATAYVRAEVAGLLDAAEQTVVGARYRIGGIGVAGCRYNVTMSWRDLAEFMMTMSDNAATDIIYHRLGNDAIQEVLSDLHLTRTRLNGCCEDIFMSAAVDLGVPYDDLESALKAAAPEQLRALSLRDPERTISSTPREITRLLRAIWSDQAAPAVACEALREMMSRQIWQHRLASGFPDEVSIAAKTGTLDGIRNEAGVITYPDGRSYAVAVFTRTDNMAERLPRLDAAIGESARIAIDYLRQDVSQ